MGLVKKENGAFLIKKLHEKKLRQLEKKISYEERREYIDKLNDKVEISGKHKLATEEVLRILAEKPCMACGKIINPPNIYCEECREKKKPKKRHLMLIKTEFYHGIRDVI